MASYANGGYDYYYVEKIEQFVTFKGAYEIESLFEKYEAFDDDVYRPNVFVILQYCYDNYKYNSDIEEFIEKIFVVREETNILQESMEEGIYETMSSLDEKVKELCPRGNNKVVIYISLYHDKCLLFMLELY